MESWLECGKLRFERDSLHMGWRGEVVTWVTGLAGYEAVSCMLNACRHTPPGRLEEREREREHEL